MSCCNWPSPQWRWWQRRRGAVWVLLALSHWKPHLYLGHTPRQASVRRWLFTRGTLSRNTATCSTIFINILLIRGEGVHLFEFVVCGICWCVITIMEMCKAPTLRLKVLNKHTHIMYIEVENGIKQKKRKILTQFLNTMLDTHTHTHTHTHTTVFKHYATHTHIMYIEVENGI